MSTIRSHRDLRVWQDAIRLVEDCYQASEMFPKHQTYGLTSQLQRAAVSVPANIAEGHGREHLKEYLQHLAIAHGSLMEVDTHLVIAKRIGYLDAEKARTLEELVNQVGRQLNALRRSLSPRMNTLTSTSPLTQHPTSST